MQIRKAPEKLSNTKLSTCADLIEKLSGDGWTIKIRPREIYKKLGTHIIFVEFADSNQALCKQLRPFFLTEGQTPKPFNETQLKSKIDSLQDKISYNSATDNNLLKYLANALIYKAFLLDANEQIPQDKKIEEYEQKCRKEVGPENFEKLKEQYKKVEERKQDLDDKEETLRKEKYDLAKKELTWRKRCDNLKNTAKKPIHENYETDLEKLINDYKEYHEAKKNKMANDTEENRRILNESNKKYSTSKNTFGNHLESKGRSDLDGAIGRYKAYLTLKDKCEEHPAKLEAPTKEHEKAVSDYEAITGHKSFTKYKHLQKDFGREYRKLDYKISVHIRFSRSMNALNAYTKDNFDTSSFRKHDKPYQETGAHDEYGWKKVKCDNLMKLARGAINRYVTVQNGGVYTTVIDHNRERSKFAFGPSGITDDDKKTVLWNFKDHNDDNYALKDRIKDSCANFNEHIDKYVISTYANYYCADNVLEVDGNRRLLYLEYVYDEDKNEKQLEIPLVIDQEKGKQKAKLHVFFENKNVYNLDPKRSGGFRYKQTPIGVTKRTQQNKGPLDISGLLYTIRKNKIAVCPPKNRFHSSMWAGKKVQAAGLLDAWNGKLVVVDNMSGHYQPNWYMLYMAWEPFFNQGVFHDSAILGISTPFEVVSDPNAHDEIGIKAVEGVDRCNQFFNVKKFMELAKNDFKIGETVMDLQIPIKEKVSIDSNESQDQTENPKCNNVLKTCYVRQYDEIWNNKEYSKLLACNFIASMEYNWNEVIPNAKTHYEEIFRGKKKKLFIIPVTGNVIENIFNKRTKKFKKLIKKMRVNKAETSEEYNKLDKKLKDATVEYKRVLSGIGSNSDLKDEDKYELITSIANIYYANDELSKFIEKVIGSSDKDIEKYKNEIFNWVDLTGSLLEFTANKKTGLGGDEIYLNKAEQMRAAKKLPENTLGNLNINLTERGEQEARVDAYRLVSPETYTSTSTSSQTTTQQQQQPNRSTSSSSQTSRQTTRPQTRSPQQRRTTGSTTTGGKTRYICIDCGNEMALYPHDRRNCSQCGHTGCLDRIV